MLTATLPLVTWNTSSCSVEITPPLNQSNGVLAMCCAYNYVGTRLAHLCCHL